MGKNLFCMALLITARFCFCCAALPAQEKFEFRELVPGNDPGSVVQEVRVYSTGSYGIGKVVLVRLTGTLPKFTYPLQLEDSPILRMVYVLDLHGGTSRFASLLEDEELKGEYERTANWLESTVSDLRRFNPDKGLSNKLASAVIKENLTNREAKLIDELQEENLQRLTQIYFWDSVLTDGCVQSLSDGTLARVVKTSAETRVKILKVAARRRDEIEEQEKRLFAEFWTEVRDHLPANFRKAVERYQRAGKPLYPQNLEMAMMDLQQFIGSAAQEDADESERVNVDTLLLNSERTYRYEDLVELRLVNKKTPKQKLPQCSAEVARKIRANLLLLRELASEGAAFRFNADQVGEFKKAEFDYGEKLGNIIGRCRTEWLMGERAARPEVEKAFEQNLSDLVSEFDRRINDQLMGDEKELVQEIRLGALMQYFGPLTALIEQPEPLDDKRKEELVKQLRLLSQKIQKQAVKLEQESIEELIDCFPAKDAELIRERLGERPAWATSYLSRHRHDLVYRSLF